MENKQFPQPEQEPVTELTGMPELDMPMPEAEEPSPELFEEPTELLEADVEEIIAEVSEEWIDSAEEPHEEAIAEIAEEPVSEPAEDLAELIVQEPIEEILEFIAPELGEEILPDESVMDAYDMTEHMEAEVDFGYEEPEYDRNYRAPAEDQDFDTMFHRAPSQSLDAGEFKPRPPRKGRPKRKKGYGFFGIPHLIATAIWLLIILGIGTSLGRMLWLCAADVLAFGREDKSVTVTITADDTIPEIADKLHNAGLIRYPGLFELYASLAVDDGEIATGTFTLNTIYDYHAIVNGMSRYSSFRNVIEDVLIPEGYSCRQIFALLEEKGICNAADLEEYAANGEFSDYWFLEGIERGDKYCLEGFLFPDTYDFYEGSTPREALGKMLSTFSKRVDEDMQAQLTVLNERLSTMMRNNGCSAAYIAEHQLTMYDVVIVASLIEEETSSAAESARIASVIYNRLTQDQAYERYLGIDATILYALGEHKEELTADDLAMDSPYNTRIYEGLVPTPITNPGLDSLTAALNPAETDFYYYILNPSTGTHVFSKTIDEHEALKAKYGG